MMNKVFGFMFMVIMSVALFTACNKEEPTKVTITVVDQFDNVVQGAAVRLFADPDNPTGDPTRLNRDGVTDGAGRVVFDYTEEYKLGQSGFAVLEVEAIKDTLIAEDLIKILEQEDNEKKLILE